MLSAEFISFSAFLVFIITVLFVDLKLVGRKSHVIKFSEALTWTIIWVSLAIGFYFFILNKGEIFHGLGEHSSIEDVKAIITKFRHPVPIDGTNSVSELLSLYRKNLGLEYITGYLIEYSLSIDNVFVMIMIFLSFGVREKHYKKILFWGILGAIVMRFIFIFLSAALIQRFEWILFIFGGFLIYTGVMMYIHRNQHTRIDTHHHPVVRFVSKHFPVFHRNVGDRFTIRRYGKLFVTPMFVVLLVIEFSDVVFAVDSVPAIFAVTKDPYIVFFSNVFAILGLRSMFFLLSNIMTKFRYLKHGLAVLLTFIGIKMILHQLHLLPEWFETIHSLYVVLGILVVSILASIILPQRK